MTSDIRCHNETLYDAFKNVWQVVYLYVTFQSVNNEGPAVDLFNCDPAGTDVV